MVAAVDALLPREHAPTIRRLAAEVDETLAGFLRGQGTVMLILGVYYAGALMVAGLTLRALRGLPRGARLLHPLRRRDRRRRARHRACAVPVLGRVGHDRDRRRDLHVGPDDGGPTCSRRSWWGAASGCTPSGCCWRSRPSGRCSASWACWWRCRSAAMLGVIARFGIERYRASTLYRGTEEPLPADPPAPAPVAAPPPPAPSRRAS